MKRIWKIAAVAAVILLLVFSAARISATNRSKDAVGKFDVSNTDITGEKTMVTAPTTTTTETVTVTTTSTTATTAALQLNTCATQVYCMDSAQLEVSYGDAVKWESSNPETVSVDKNGKITTYKAGKAVITVYDKNGNTAKCEVESLKVVYLTIDDSPNDNTERLLEVLAEYDIKATFFLCGPYYNEERYKKIADGGHTVANHTKTHDMSFYDDYDVFLKAVKDQAKAIERYTGKKALKIFRFPGGSRGHWEFAQNLRYQNYHIFDWTATLGDTSSKATPETCFANVKKYTTEDREIILMHYKSHSIEALPQIIEYLKEQGYVFAPITMETKPYSFV